MGVKEVEVKVKGPGSGRESAITAIQASGLSIKAIEDVTPPAAQRLPPSKEAPRLVQGLDLAHGPPPDWPSPRAPNWRPRPHESVGVSSRRGGLNRAAGSLAVVWGGSVQFGSTTAKIRGLEERLCIGGHELTAAARPRPRLTESDPDEVLDCQARDF